MANFVKFGISDKLNVPNTEGRTCTDVLNCENSIERWVNVLKEFSLETLPPAATDGLSTDNNRGHLAIKAILDISSSMDGNKLTAVKLGLCAVIAHLGDADTVSISSFNSVTSQLTDGFQPVAELRSMLPEVLYKLYADGCTACYDSTVEGMNQLKAYADAQVAARTGTASSATVELAEPAIDDDKHIVIVLTDGSDNASRRNSRAVFEALSAPGMDAFMFIMVAVEMSRRDERCFRSWLELSHCKQVSVQVRTGTMLVKVFKEILMARVLQTAVTSERFYYRRTGPVVRAEITERVHTELSRSALERAEAEWAEQDQGDAGSVDFGRLGRAHSPAISICESCSDHGDDDGDDDMDNYYAMDSPRGSFSGSDTDTDDDGSAIFSPHAGPYGHGVPAPASVIMVPPSPVIVPQGLDLTGVVLPAEFRCPITQELMLDPVVACDGHTYDRSAIEKWLRTPSETAEASIHTSPLTNLPLENDTLIANRSIRTLIQELVDSMTGANANANANANAAASSTENIKMEDA